MEAAVTLHHSGRLADAVSAVEREIAAIWTSEPGAPPKTRASTANLVIVAGGSHIEAARTLAESLATAEVARTLVVSVDPKLPPWGVDAAVSARCRVDGHGEVCSERIDLTVGASVMSRAASLISALCVTEVPTSILAIFPAPSALLSSLVRLGDQLVIDTDESSIESSLLLTNESRSRVHDLAWARLLPWRHHIARCFDDLRTRCSVMSIRRVVIRTTPPEGGGVSAPARWVLGWLGSRLGWRFTSATSAVDALNRPVAIDIEWRRAPLHAGSLLDVELVADATDIPLQLSLSRGIAASTQPGDHWSLQVIREGEEIGVEDKTFRIQPLSTATLVDRAIHDATPDSVLRQTLARAASFPPSSKRALVDDQPQSG